MRGAVNIVDSGIPSTAAHIALAVREHLVTTLRAHRSVERVVHRNLYSHASPLRKLRVNRNNVVTAVAAAAVHARALGCAAHHNVLYISARMLADHLLQFRIDLRSAGAGNGDIAALRKRAECTSDKESEDGDGFAQGCSFHQISPAGSGPAF